MFLLLYQGIKWSGQGMCTLLDCSDTRRGISTLLKCRRSRFARRCDIVHPELWAIPYRVTRY